MQNVIETLQQLIAFPTVSRDSNLELIQFVAGRLQQHGVTATRVYNSEKTKANLFATIGPNEPGGVVLSGHSDVVPVDHQPWDTDPFVMQERDGRFYGRGTCDMKAFLAIALGLLPEMRPLKKPLHLAISYDEEVGCVGAPQLIREMKRHIAPPEAVIVGEPTMMETVTSHKGVTVVKTAVQGHEAHSSQTHLGISAVMIAARMVNYLEHLSQELQALASPANHFMPHGTTIHVGMIKGGTAVNIISRDCEFCWDIRNLPEDDPKQVLQSFQHYCDTQLLPEMHAVNTDCGYHTDVIASAPALHHHADNPAAELTKTLTGQTQTNKVAYAAEAGQFQEAGWATVLCGPGSIEQAHQPNEYISRDQLEQGAQFLRNLIHRLSA
jgi:acetylornithine deacetylase